MFGTRLRDYPEKTKKLLQDYYALKEIYPTGPCVVKAFADGLISKAEGSLILEALRISEEA